MRRLAIVLLVLLIGAARAQEQPLTIALPAQSELSKLADLVAQFVGVSVQYNPQKLTGSVRLSVRGQLSAGELWDLFNQVLIAQNLTTVLAGEPPVYQIVPINEAAALAGVMDSARLDAMRFTPGYAVVVLELMNLSPETAVKSLSVLLSGQASTAKTVGQDQRRIMIAATTVKVREAMAALRALDRPGVAPEVRTVRPERSAPQTLQPAAIAAWAAWGRIKGQNRPAEIQIAPDGAQLLLIAASEDIDELEHLVHDLDHAEPSEVRTYRSRSFSADEVASLLTQILKPEHGGAAAPDIVRDKLTGSLIVKGTAAQHKRVEDVLRMLDDAPATARRQVRTFVIKNRQADELAKVLRGLITSGIVEAGGTAANEAAAARPEPAPTTSAAPAGVEPGEPPANTLPNTPLPAPTTATTAANPPTAAPAFPTPSTHQPLTVAGMVHEQPVTITADMLTNRLIVLGDPRALDQVASLIAQLDRRQPQVDLEVILVSLSETQNRDLGIELAGQVSRGGISYGAASLFGLSSAAAGAPFDRQLPTSGANALTGFGGVVLKPGDFAVVVRALENVTSGHSLIRSHVVVNNNAKASVNGVVQEPLTSVNSSATVATTSVTGTSDAGTQIAVTPTISQADYLSIAYTISQSSFLGDPQLVGGTVVPPTKRSDAVSSVATIPDGHVIAVGGLSNRSTGSSESRIPWLGSIPLLGNLFKHQTSSSNESRFFVFIRPTIMRHDDFADLRYLSGARAADAKVDDQWPTVEAALLK